MIRLTRSTVAGAQKPDISKGTERFSLIKMNQPVTSSDSLRQSIIAASIIASTVRSGRLPSPGLSVTVQWAPCGIAGSSVECVALCASRDFGSKLQ